MTEYSRMRRGNFVSTGAAQIINLPFQPDAVKFVNYSSFATPANHGIPRAYWDSSMGQGYATVDLFNSTPVLTTDVVTSGGISTFAAGQLLQFGAQQQVVASTKGTTTSFQVTAHGYSTGDVVIFQGLYQSSTTGMPQMCGIPFTVTKVDANNFTVLWNSNNSSYTNLSTSPAGAYVKKVLYPYLYAPGVSFIYAITTGTTTTVQTTTANNFVVGQEVAFRIPSAWGTTQLNSLPDTLIPGSPIYGYVQSITNATTFVISTNSTGYTAFTTAQSVASVPGLQFPQVLAAGDVNTGGVAYSGSQLYPSPLVNGFSTINGPAISGAFVNNTSQGFIIGAGASATDSASVLVGANGNVVYWEAFLYD